MRAILICVEYDDLLEITLPYNRHHFSEVMVVTTPYDHRTIAIATEQKAAVYTTLSFFDNEAVFNKWKALEEGLDRFGRKGLMCIMDADVLWPTKIGSDKFIKGNLYTPVRRLLSNYKIPKESGWKKIPTSKESDFAGYTQIFWANDPHLPKSPWHELDWTHAGGADTTFQNLWPISNRIRPKWNVLHIGPTGTNWCGRCSTRMDGTIPIESKERYSKLKGFMEIRKRSSEETLFQAEKIQ